LHIPYTKDGQRAVAFRRLVNARCPGPPNNSTILASDYGRLQILPWNRVARRYNSFDVMRHKSKERFRS
jgi:hypothetical protein